MALPTYSQPVEIIGGDFTTRVDRNNKAINDYGGALHADLSERIDLTADQITTNNIVAATWVSLAALTGTITGQGAEVLDADTGTHTDPVSGTTVPNAGRFRWTGSAWQRIGDTGLSGKADGVLAAAGAGLTPLIAAGGQVVMWLGADGTLQSPGLNALRGDISGKADAFEADAPALVPLIVAGSRVLLWLDADGNIAGPGISASVTPDARRIASDGRTLVRAKAKTSLIRKAPAGTDRLRIAVMGDSWADLTTIPLALRGLAADTLGVIGEGWQAVQGNTQMNGVTYARSAGWTLWDASDGITAWTYGAGADGKLITTGLATDTLTIGNLNATSIRIYSFAHGGTWRYRVDGGAWTIVTEATGGALTVTTIPGLAATAHSLEIDTTGNTGTVSIAGIYSTGTGAGIEILKMGNASLDGAQLATYVNLIGGQLADLAPDLILCLLGTNDSRRAGKTPAIYVAALAALASVARTALPDVGLVFVAPSQATTTGLVTPVSEYSDALDAWCAANDAEFLSLTRQMGTYNQTQPLGIWADTVHHNAVGADMIARIVDTTFLHL